MSLGVVPLPGPLPVPASGSKGDRSKTFWPFLELMKALSVDNRATRMIVLENVCSALTSHVGRDFAAIGAALSSGWYRFGGLVIDAPRFVSQSHPRFFIVVVYASLPGLIAGDPAFDRDDVTGNRQFTNDLRPDRGFPTSAPTNAAAWIAGIVIVAGIII